MLRMFEKLCMWAHGITLFNRHQHGIAPCAPSCLTLHQFSEALGNAVDARDPHLYNHSRDVAEIARVLAVGMRFSRAETELIHIAGHLHDVGKIGIPDTVLKKRGALDENEWQWMKRHPEIGAEIVRPVLSFNTPGGVADIIFSHHEQYDGSGYPQRLSAEAIPMGARIVAVADTLSALVRDRYYRRGCTFDEAFAEINRCSGVQFDPAVVRTLEINLHEVREILLAPQTTRDVHFSEQPEQQDKLKLRPQECYS